MVDRQSQIESQVRVSYSTLVINQKVLPAIGSYKGMANGQETEQCIIAWGGGGGGGGVVQAS